MSARLSAEAQPSVSPSGRAVAEDQNFVCAAQEMAASSRFAISVTKLSGGIYTQKALLSLNLYGKLIFLVFKVVQNARNVGAVLNGIRCLKDHFRHMAQLLSGFRARGVHSPRRF